jgi:hypothetical protein
MSVFPPFVLRMIVRCMTSSACAGTVMGLSRSAAPPGIPQKIWESSSALRSLCESAETDGHDLLRILDDLNTFGRIRQQHRTALLQERHRLGDMLESVANIATEEIASGMSPSDPQHPNASTAASAAASEAFAGSEPEPEIQPEPEADEDSELAAALELSMQADTAGTTAEAEASTLIDTARSPVQPDGRLLRDAAGVLTCSQIIRDDAGPHSVDDDLTLEWSGSWSDSSESLVLSPSPLSISVRLAAYRSIACSPPSGSDVPCSRRMTYFSMSCLS